MWIKTNELTGKALDWAVEYSLLNHITNSELRASVSSRNIRLREVGYSTDWSQGGPIIEREKVALDFCHHDLVWFALIEYKTDKFKADNPLVAAMRCYVASKLGDEIEVPDELV